MISVIINPMGPMAGSVREDLATYFTVGWWVLSERTSDFTFREDKAAA